MQNIHQPNLVHTDMPNGNVKRGARSQMDREIELPSFLLQDWIKAHGRAVNPLSPGCMARENDTRQDINSETFISPQITQKPKQKKCVL